MLKELPRHPLSGIPLLFAFPILFVLNMTLLVWLVSAGLPWAAIASGVFALCIIVALFGFFMVHPNEARVLQLFGAYVGTARDAGLRWANPFYTRRKVSVRIRNFETGK